MVDDATAVELWGRVIHGFQATNRRLHAEMRYDFDLNEAEAETLLELHRQPEHRAKLSFLAKGAGFSTGGFTKIADKLSNRGLAVRVACEEDRRVSYLGLTEGGLEMASALTAAVANANRRHFIDVLGEEQACQVATAMTYLYRANLV